MTDEPRKEEIDKLCRDLADAGKLIEAGFASLCVLAYPDASAEEITEIRNAFFAGAIHLFGSIFALLDTQTEATEADLHRITLIDAELQEFIEAYKAAHGVPK